MASRHSLPSLAAKGDQPSGRCFREAGKDGAERPQVTCADAGADLGVVLRAGSIGAQFVFAQSLGVVSNRGEVQRLADALLDAVGQRDLLALREAVRDERVVQLVPEDVGIQRVGCVQMQLTEVWLLERELSLSGRRPGCRPSSARVATNTRVNE